MAPTKTKAQKQFNVAPKIVVTPETSAYYANYVLVAHSQYDFSLSFARITPPLSDEQLELLKKGEPFPVDAMLQITIPPAVAEGLITALTAQRDAYRALNAKTEEMIEKHSGKRSKPNPVQ